MEKFLKFFLVVLGTIYIPSSSCSSSMTKSMQKSSMSPQGLTYTHDDILEICTTGNIKLILKVQQQVESHNQRSTQKIDTPLNVAVEHNLDLVVKGLLSQGADKNVLGKSGTPLFLAALKGHDEPMKALIEARANLEFPLLTAAKGGHTLAVERLILAGADVTFKLPSDGATALHFAAFEGHEECVGKLLTLGALVNALRNDGSSPLDLAKTNQKLGCVKILAQAGGLPVKSAKPGEIDKLYAQAQFSYFYRNCCCFSLLVAACALGWSLR